MSLRSRGPLLAGLPDLFHHRGLLLNLLGHILHEVRTDHHIAKLAMRPSEDVGLHFVKPLLVLLVLALTTAGRLNRQNAPNDQSSSSTAHALQLPTIPASRNCW